jgi:hypothetical protein
MEPQFHESMIDSLVMNDERKMMLKALAKSFARVNRRDEQLDRELWTADFVQGKGSGLVFLLHGQPGVGKTCTAGKKNNDYIPWSHVAHISLRPVTQSVLRHSPDDH